MVFSSFGFVFSFLPLVLLGYYLLSWLIKDMPLLRRCQNLLLIFASLVFYGWFDPSYLWIIMASILVNYALALGMRSRRDSKPIKKALLILGIVFNVAMIGWFKYYDFFAENINFLFHTDIALKHLLLPLGISFFTFQQLSFLVSVYKEEEQVEDFINYCVFVLFFPQLVAGPIVLYSEMVPQFKDSPRCRFNSHNMASGIYIFCIGLFKKAVLADTLALFVNNGFAQESLGFLPALAVVLGYALQIYFDFSGYSDMAVGLGRMFNIDIPFNFLSPYKSESFTELWRRWHITLGRALSSYIYKPLGGSRKGLSRTCINLMLTFLISGLWHGAAWTFIIWGLGHGAFTVLERCLGEKLNKIPHPLRVLSCFLFCSLLWVVFRVESFQQAGMVYEGMLGLNGLGYSQIAALAMDNTINFPTIVDAVYIFGMVGVLLWVVFTRDNSRDMLLRFKPCGRTLGFTALLFCLALIHLSRESIFIYFNF